MTDDYCLEVQIHHKNNRRGRAPKWPPGAGGLLCPDGFTPQINLITNETKELDLRLKSKGLLCGNYKHASLSDLIPSVMIGQSPKSFNSCIWNWSSSPELYFDALQSLPSL